MAEKTKQAVHTPGPWSVEVKKHSVEILVGPDDPRTDVIKWRLYGGEDAVTIANARLIAAAPDLLDALKALVNAINNPDAMSGTLIDNADAAIAKAEEGSK